MITFHGNPEIKAKYVARLKEHQRLDEIVQKETFSKNGKTRGCAVGCTLDKYDHKSYEVELGVPEGLAYLEDSIFEGLTPEKAPQFAVDFLEAIPIGVDLTPIRWRFCAFVMRKNIDRVLLLNIDKSLKEKVVAAISSVLKVHEKAIELQQWDESAARSASRASAWKAARSAALSAAQMAEPAALSATWSAESAALSATWSAKSADWSAARSAARLEYAQEILRLLKLSEVQK